MNYDLMIREHIKNKAAVTIAVMKVPIEEASRFGVMNAREDGRIYEFEEKPINPKSDLVSMGIYVFDFEILEKYLTEDDNDPNSDNDFGKNVIPKMLAAGEDLFTYEYNGFWMDVGTIESLFEANMELLSENPRLKLYDKPWKIYSRNRNKPPEFISEDGIVKNSIISEGCIIYGEIENSILSPGVIVEKGAKVKNSIIINDCLIKENAEVNFAILDENVTVAENVKIGCDYLPLQAGNPKITLISSGSVIDKKIAEGEII
jgi:glucose-1-phosphate adenylyltransferase